MSTGVPSDGCVDNCGDKPQAAPAETLSSPIIVGRQAEIAELDAILEPHIIRDRHLPQVINIHGIPGIGKRSLGDIWQQHIKDCRSAVVTKLPQHEIEQGIASGISLSRQLENCTSDYRADLVFLNTGDIPADDETAWKTILMGIESFMSAKGDNKGRNRNRTVIALTSTQELRLQDYFLMRMFKTSVQVGQLTKVDAIEFAGGNEEKGLLLHQLTGGYAPALITLAQLDIQTLRESIGEDRNDEAAQLIAGKLLATLTNEHIWSYIRKFPYANPANRDIPFYASSAKQLLILLANSTEPIHIPEITRILGLTSQHEGLAVLDLIRDFVEWKHSSDGKTAGYTIQEPLKTILANIYSVDGENALDSVL